MTSSSLDEHSLHPVSIALHRPSLLTPGLILASTVSGAFAIEAAALFIPRLFAGAPWSEIQLHVIVFAFWSFVLSYILLRRMWVYKTPLPSISFHDTYMLLPKHILAKKASRLEYKDILSIALRSGANDLQFAIESTKHLYFFNYECFDDPKGPEHVLRELRMRLMRMPEGLRILATMEERRFMMMHVAADKPYATQALVGVAGVFFANLYLLRALEQPFGLLNWGASVPFLIQHGEWYRLFSASFLHASLPHFVMCIGMLYSLGTMLERMMGWAYFLIIVLSSALIGTLTSAFITHTMMFAGLSAACAGILGAVIVLNIHFKTQLPFGLRHPWRWWLLVAIVALFLPFLWMLVDVQAHAFAFLWGASLTYGLVFRRLKFFPPMRMTLPAWIVSGLLVTLYTTGLSQSVMHVAHTDMSADVELAQQLLKDPSMSADALNVMAWVWATDPRTEKPQLQAALTLSQASVARMPQEAGYRDTLAMVFHRLQQYDDALDGEAQALALEDHPLYASQLNRFLYARWKAQGRRWPEHIPYQALQVSQLQSGDLEFLLKQSFHEPVTVWCLVFDGDVREGLLRVHIEANTWKAIVDKKKYPFISELHKLKIEPVWFEISATKSGGPVHYWPNQIQADLLP